MSTQINYSQLNIDSIWNKQLLKNDTSGNGSIDYSEYRNDLDSQTDLLSKASFNTVLKKAYKRVDTNLSGEIDKPELSTYVEGNLSGVSSDTEESEVYNSIVKKQLSNDEINYYVAQSIVADMVYDDLNETSSVSTNDFLLDLYESI